MDFESLLEEHRITLYKYWITRYEQSEEEAQEENKEELNAQFGKLVDLSSKNNIYWRLCEFPAFEKYYNIIRAAREIAVESQDNFDFDLDREMHDIIATFNEGQIVLFDIPLFFLDVSQRLTVVGDLKRKIDFLSEFKYSSQNPYPLIFMDSEAFRKFEFLKDNLGTKSADLSYIFHQMWNERGDSEIICSSTDYIKFLKEKYGIELSKVKTLNQAIETIDRERKYRSLINDYKFS
ncbi:MAG: hypothetical protein RIM99_14520 [Cyclobacteriaceae bacterium]